METFFKNIREGKQIESDVFLKRGERPTWQDCDWSHLLSVSCRQIGRGSFDDKFDSVNVIFLIRVL